MITIIYFSGVISSFLIGRYTYRMMCKNDEMNYDSVLATANIFMSMTSWIGAIAFSIVYLIAKPRKIKENKKDKKVPKWL